MNDNSLTKQIGKYTAKVERLQGNALKTFIKYYLQDNIVKFIFYDRACSSISTFPNVGDIHKIRHNFSAKKYVRFPLNFIWNESKYVTGIEITDNELECDGFVLLAKEDVRRKYEKLKYNTKERNEMCEKLCKEEVETYNNILQSCVFEISFFESDDCKGVTYIIGENGDTEKTVMEKLENVTEEEIDNGNYNLIGKDNE